MEETKKKLSMFIPLSVYEKMKEGSKKEGISMTLYVQKAIEYCYKKDVIKFLE